VRLYLDSSALVKLVRREAESPALRRLLRRHRSDGKVTSVLARVEVVRAVAGGGSDAVAQARRLLARLDQINLTRELLDDAAVLAPGATLRSLDAIHVTSALMVGADLRAIVTNDQRMQDAAAIAGLVVEAPA
jgi:predicted nucleic acid-binding protein